MTSTPTSVETFFIRPTSKYHRPPPPSTIVLHELDLSGAGMDMRLHRFYHRPQSGLFSTPADVIDRLKSSLAEALELYPPVAGTVRADDQDELHIVMDAENYSGTPFLVEIKDTPYVGDADDLAPRPIMLPPLPSTLAVKVTQFSCGTIAVAASMNHQVADLRGFLDFLEVWAQLARDEPIDFTKLPDDWSHTPGRFFSDLMSQTTVGAPPPGFTVLPAPRTEPPAFYLAPSEVSRWKFTKSAVDRLKEDFSPAATSDQWISSGDALAALLWGVITRAREKANVPARFDPQSPTETLLMAADGRGRSPQGNMLDRRYFGNFNPLFRAIAARSDLLSLESDSAARVALAIRAALNAQLSPEAIAEKISFLEDPRNAKPPGRIVFSADVILTNWCQFDLHGPQLDLGWGKPFCTTAGGFPGAKCPPGYILLMQERSAGDIIVLLAVEQEGAEGLKADFLLNKYATLITAQ